MAVEINRKKSFSEVRPLHHVMFDVDGTLVQSYDFDARCFIDAVKEVLNVAIDSNWSRYKHVTDTGIVDEIIDLNNLGNRKDKLREEIKHTFVRKIAKRIKEKPAQEVPGASSFLSRLNSMDNIALSIATGGWYESALLKLNSAGISVSHIPMASSNDHFSRTEIMKIARSRAYTDDTIKCTYFGDAAWDKKACHELGYNFVLVGNRVDHHQCINNFLSVHIALSYIGI